MAGQDNSDLLGGEGSDSTGGAGSQSASSPQGGMLGAVSKAVDQTEAAPDELALVKKTMEEYTTARGFDKPARLQFAKDRRYASGKADTRWASDANLIGSFIDIMVSFLYAQNPDISVRPSEKVGMQPDQNAADFAETAELVDSRLWRDGRLKKTEKKVVRSSLSVGQGWLKALMYTDKTPAPQIEADILTQKGLLDRFNAQKAELGSTMSPPADEDAAKAAAQITLQGLQAKEAALYKTGMCFDFIRAEDIQVSLDVASISDYLDADWVSNDLYVLKTSVREKFPTLKDDDISAATIYYQRPTMGKDTAVTSSQSGDSAADGSYTRSAPETPDGGGKSVEFVKVIEMWRKCQGMIVTMIEGVKRWAVEPYAPPQATSRFYPYFYTSLFEVDGERHPQSLVFRLFKLQDEYSACRSNQRLVRERSIPAVIFNRGGLSPEDAKKVADGSIQELIGLMPVSVDTPLQNLFIAKPIPAVNMALYDTTPIKADMEAISGVQEALQAGASSNQPKTATEASIQQTGFASRTNADRDSIEDVLSDLAHYTTECAIQEVRPPQAQRIAGKQAFWPFGMDVQDILTLVEIDIDAGSTGKPDMKMAQQNWTTILPMLEQLITKVRALQVSDPPLAAALENLVRETLHRLDDRLDISEFIPTEPPPPPPPPPPPLPPEVKVNIGLTGALPPGDAQAILDAEGAAHGMQMPGAPPVASPGGAPPGGPPPLPGGASMPMLPGGVPMPPLSQKLAPGALKPGPAAPGAGTPK